MSSIDIENPAYPLPSTNIALPTKLWFNNPKTNYEAWREQMLCLIEGQDLLGFIDGSISPPQPEDKMWRRSDVSVKGWILCSLNDDIVSSVANLKTARQVWLELEKMFCHISDVAALRGAPSPTLRDPSCHKKYVQLHRAALACNWDEAEPIFKSDPHAVKARLDGSKSTALHVVIGLGRKSKIDFVRKLVALMPNDEDIAQVNVDGETALSIAAATGNKVAAEILVGRMRSLLYISNCGGDFPVQIAAKNGQKDTLEYLISATEKEYNGQKPYSDLTGLRLLLYVIDAGLFGIGLRLVEKDHSLAKLKLPDNTSALKKVAELVPSKTYDLKLWEKFIVLVTSMRKILDPISKSIEGDIEGRMTNNAGQANGEFQISNAGWIFKFIQILAPKIIKRLVQKLLPEYQRKKLILRLCDELLCVSSEEAFSIYSHAILIAAQLDNYDVVQSIVEVFPSAIYTSVDGEFMILHEAIRNRWEFYLIKRITIMSYREDRLYSDLVDSEGNNILHLAAKLAPPHHLNTFSGAAFQMQSELAWYRKVDGLLNGLNPYCKLRLNKEGKTPQMVFTEEHMNLKEAAEKWYKDTANSCAIVATLMVTLMFAAAITVPGGTEPIHGFPFYSKQSAYQTFTISTVISMCTSITCLSVFLALSLTTHSEKRFEKYLPAILQVGLVALHTSLVFTLVAFNSAVYLVLGKKKKWVFALTNGLVVPILIYYSWMIYFPLTTQLGKINCPQISCPRINWSRFKKKSDKKKSKNMSTCLIY